MTWTYTMPIATDLDRVRFMTGDTVESDPLLQNEEIAYALSVFADVRLAAALCLRTLIAKCAREGNVSVGEVSVSSSRSQQWKYAADTLDPAGITVQASMALPRFGGLSIAEKEAYEGLDDSVPTWFTRDMDDNLGDDSDD